MTALRAIDGKPYKDRLALGGGPVAPSLGDKPQLRWIAIECLRVDAAYQREITLASSKNVVKIAREFDWAMFAPCIVVEEKKGVYLVIDGQHRATAAALRGIRDVPCQIVVADRAKQAAAFTAINANVTRMLAIHIYHARLAAGDQATIAFSQALEAGGVAVSKHPTAADKIAAGLTMSTSDLLSILRKYGRDTFALALRCITKTKDGNPGCIRAPIVEALCAVFEAEPEFAKNETRLLKSLQGFDLPSSFNQARRDAGGKHSGTASALVELLSGHLDRDLGSRAA